MQWFARVDYRHCIGEASSCNRRGSRRTQSQETRRPGHGSTQGEETSASGRPKCSDKLQWGSTSRQHSASQASCALRVSGRSAGRACHTVRLIGLVSRQSLFLYGKQQSHTHIDASPHHSQLTHSPSQWIE